MKVVLLKNVSGAGKLGDVKDVADGYAMNFLIPRGMARVATESALQERERASAEERQRAEEDLREAQKAASKLDGGIIEMSERVSEEGTLYAAVGAKKIADAIKKKFGISVSYKDVVIARPIKARGEHDVRVRFPHGLEAELSVIVSE